MEAIITAVGILALVAFFFSPYELKIDEDDV